ncbi:DUF3336 domain-containing protein [Parasphingorhabdus litoris]|uniref:DUF3336 domain-containing protein n=1 Tax=Parasphingorhabdus litoris TaxID=394733 RepID=A0ABN1ANR8_9SPHN|nr:DUF3336 domain-containing protein [Parasphingorhabdus litoris]
MILNTTLKMEKAMAQAENYSEWSDAAAAHDRSTGVDKWKAADESKHFDNVSIRRRLKRLSKLWKAQDNAGLLYALNEGIHGNMDGMGNDRLHQKAKFGTKQLIQDYVDAIVNSLEYLASDKVDDIPFEEKLDFFRRAQHCYGRSAFLMSGSGAFLYFHMGVVKALWSEGLLPHIMSGSSGGSIVGALISTHVDSEIPPFFEPENLVTEGSDEIASQTGLSIFGGSRRLKIDEIRERIATMIPDLTFQEAYELTGRHLNVSIAPAEKHQTSRLLNAIASPNVYIREAVMASCAVPGVYPPVTLAAKDHKGERKPYLPNRKWVDGSVTHDLPAKRLGRLYGVNHHIVSQANPLITPFATDVKQQRTPISAIRNATTSTMKAWLNANVEIMQKPLSYFPRLNSMANMTLSVINQDYTGDINIIRPTMFWSPSKILSDLTVEEITELIQLGERTTWPKIEMVRTQTKISQTLDRILFEYETELAHDHMVAVKRKIA